MAQIGTFTRAEDGSYTGTIKTLALNIKARFLPAEPSEQREGAGPARDGRQRRDRCRVAADLEGEHRLSLGQARRPILPGAAGGAAALRSCERREWSPLSGHPGKWSA